MAHIDKEPIIEMVKRHYPMQNAENTRMFQHVVEACFFAGYSEQDIAEFCESLSDFSDEAFQRGINAANTPCL